MGNDGTIRYLYDDEREKWYCLKHKMHFDTPNRYYFMEDPPCPICTNHFFIHVEFIENGERIKLEI